MVKKGAIFDRNGCTSFGPDAKCPIEGVAPGGIQSVDFGDPIEGLVGAPRVWIINLDTNGNEVADSKTSGGLGATAVADWDPATRTLKGVNITSRGWGYQQGLVKVKLTIGSFWSKELILDDNAIVYTQGHENDTEHPIRFSGLSGNGGRWYAEENSTNGATLKIVGEWKISAKKFVNRKRHPRSMFGRRNDGTILLVAVDGRSKRSAGMSIPEMQSLALTLGCKEALNLDGGGSTTLWVDGKILNRPNDGHERRVQNAVVVTLPSSR